MDAFVDLDAEGIEEYIDDPSAIPEDFKNLDADVALEDLPSELSAYEDDFKGAFDAVIDKAKEDLEYEIKDVEENDGEYTFTVEVTVPNMEDVNFDAIMGEQFNNDTLNNMLTEMLETGEILETSTEEEILDIVMPKIVEIMKEEIDAIEMETATEEIELVVTEVDGEWLITLKRANLTK